ncbi:hypothetical protein RHMOL_Rhmol11G0052900 [Rhododendron molle]|uniref:Uncharacterized protein n=1 Tax=Rhododendron molle TaxID=49168 RepID=A0ACC0LP95_RHOML|nr:hypothetical protein RHMOL_Rhmol11G0052900 [Rhododendron molle]
MPKRVQELVNAAEFGLFILTLSATKSDHAVMTTLAERWQDTSNTFHFPIGEMTVTSLDFAVITGLRVEGESIPFDSGLQRDASVLRWFLGEVPEKGEEMVWYDQFWRYLRGRIPTTEQEEEKMARAYLLYLFGATLYPTSAPRYTCPTCQPFATFARHLSMTGEEQLWGHVMCSWQSSPAGRKGLLATGGYGRKASKGSLLAFRAYLDELSSIQVEWDPWSSVEAEPEYIARSRVVIASRVLLELAFGWQWYLGDRVT